jgi:hypothetical protein
MVLAAITDLILIMFYLLLGYITFKELSNKRASEETFQRILLKWMTSAVFFSGFWVFEYIFYFAPTSLLKLPVGLWILMPQFYGEYTLYNMFAELFERLEYYFRNVRNSAASMMFGSTFSMSVYFFNIIKKFIPQKRLIEFQDEVRNLFQDITKELKLRKDITDHKLDSSDLRDSTVVHHGGQKNPKPPTYFKPPSGQIYTPVGLFTKFSSSVLDTQTTNLANEVPEEDDVRRSSTSLKKSKHGQKDSVVSRTAKKSLKETDRMSSYIDPRLTEKLNEVGDYVEKDEYRKSKKKSSKKND